MLTFDEQYTLPWAVEELEKVLSPLGWVRRKPEGEHADEKDFCFHFGEKKAYHTNWAIYWTWGDGLLIRQIEWIPVTFGKPDSVLACHHCMHVDYYPDSPIPSALIACDTFIKQAEAERERQKVEEQRCAVLS